MVSGVNKCKGLSKEDVRSQGWLSVEDKGEVFFRCERLNSDDFKKL